MTELIIITITISTTGRPYESKDEEASRFYEDLYTTCTYFTHPESWKTDSWEL